MPAVIRKRPALSGKDARRFLRLEKSTEDKLKKNVEKFLKGKKSE